MSIVQFFGQDCRDVDVDLRVKKGSLLAHWPPGTQRSGRVQWFGSSLSATPPAGIPLGYIPETHWFQKLRMGLGSAFAKGRVAPRALRRLRRRAHDPGAGQDPGRPR